MRLLKSRILRLTFRRSEWMRWFPPIESASPSPVTTQTERSGRGTAVDRVHSVGLQVVGKASSAADPRDEDDPLALEPELRQEALDHVQDRVVAATRTPADLLIRLEVLGGEGRLAVALAH